MDPEPYILLTDKDPGDTKTYGAYGSGSANENELWILKNTLHLYDYTRGGWGRAVNFVRLRLLCHRTLKILNREK